MKVLKLSVKHVSKLGALMHALHSCFTQEVKSYGFNCYGVAFPEITNGSTGLLVDVYCPEEVDDVISHPKVVQLIATGNAKLEGIKQILDTSKFRYVAFIRDRKLERGSPSQAMARMGSGTAAQKEMRAKTTMTRYFQQALPQINMESRSSQRLFTLNIATVEACGEKIKQVSTQSMQFNSYGLSSHQTPAFLPLVVSA